MAEKSKEPVKQAEGVKTDAAPPEGAHPIRPLDEQTWAASNLDVRDLPDDQKPDPSTVAQEQVLKDWQA